MLCFLDENEINLSHVDAKRVSIISAPLANTVSWGKGTEAGPLAVLEASKALETFDDELLVEIYRAGIETMPPLDLANLSQEKAHEVIGLAVKHELTRNRLPILLGGEHSITVPAVTACKEIYKDVHVLQFDAHLDLRDSYEGNPLSHACVMRRLYDLGISFSQVGIRSFSKQEFEFVQKNNITPFTMAWIRKNPDWIKKVCDTIKSPLYITIDLDGLDPSVMPATGTPEPGGLSWYEATGLFREVCSRNKIVGVDFVELAPAPGQQHAAFTAAKLVHRTIGYIFKDFFVTTGRQT